MQYRFGEFTLDTELGRLHGPAGDIVLRRQAWRLLLELIEQAPALIERDVLLDRVWGRQALSPNALPQTISELRQALGDSAREPRYIETCHGRGYRLLCPVETTARGAHEASAGQGSGHERAARIPEPGRRHWPVLVAATSLSVLVFAIILWPMPPGEQPDRPEQASLPPMVSTLRQQAEVALARKDPASAAAHLRALTLLVPDELQLGLKLAEAELDALQGQQARRTLALLTAEPAMRQHPQLMILQARLAEVDGDFEQAAALAEAARIQAGSLGQGGLLAGAAMAQANALKRQGELGLAADLLSSVLAETQPGIEEAERFELSLAVAGFRREQGQLAEAREWMDQAQQLWVEPDQQQALKVERAVLMAADGQAQKAWQALLALSDAAEAHTDSAWQLGYFHAMGTVGIEVGETERALAAFERGFSLARSTGQAYQVAGLQINAGALLARRDRLAEAEQLWQQALETFERIGDRRGQAIALGNLAAAASAQGHNTRSESLNRQALAQFRQLGLDGPLARTAFNLALVASREGRLDDAEALLAESQAAYQRAGHVEMVLHVGAYRVDHRVLAGDLIVAEVLLGELESQLSYGSPLRQAGVMASRGRLEKWRGDLPAARLALEQGRDLRIESGQAGWVATSELELLQLTQLEVHDPWALRVRALELAEHFSGIDQVRAAMRAQLLAAEALMSQGEFEQARDELAAIRSAHKQFADASLGLDLAWVEAWAAREEERLPRLEALARRASDQGYLGKLAQIEAGLAARDLALVSLIETPEPALSATEAVALLPPYVSQPGPLSPPE